MNEVQIIGLERCVQKIRELIQKGKNNGLEPKQTNISKGTIFYYNYALFTFKRIKKGESKVFLSIIRRKPH